MRDPSKKVRTKSVTTWLDALWMACLFFLPAFQAGHSVACWLALALDSSLLWVLPAWDGMLASPPHEFLGAASGILLGAVSSLRIHSAGVHR